MTDPQITPTVDESTVEDDTGFKPVVLGNGHTVSVRKEHTEVSYSPDPANVPPTETKHGPQVVYADSTGNTRTVECASESEAETLATTVANIAYLLWG